MSTVPPSSLASWTMGMLDRAYYLTRYVSRRPRFFADGWGDVASTRADQTKMIGRLCDPSSCTEQRKLATLRWDSPNESATECMGSFDSPQADELPEEAKRCRFRFISPDGEPTTPWLGASSQPPAGVVLLLPATGEVNDDARLQIARKLAAEDGVCSIILTAPCYGSRKPSSQQMHYIRTVALFLRQSLAIIEEAALLLCWCADRWPGVPLCVSGFSWGGAMTVCSAILASQWAHPAPVLAVPYAGSATPAVMVDGLLQDDIEWSALAEQGEAFEDTRNRLQQELLQMHLSKFAPLIKERGVPLLAGLRAVSFLDDHFVKREYGEELYDLACIACAASAPSTIEWHHGGHATAFLARMRIQKDAIQKIFKCVMFQPQDLY